MPKGKDKGLLRERANKLASAIEILRLLGFGSKQRNDAAGHTLLALLDLKPVHSWDRASDPLRGITPIIQFIREEYGVAYAPNTRETIRDEAVKHFAELGLIIRNPDDPNRPTNSGKTVYQIEPSALQLLRQFETREWNDVLTENEKRQGAILHEMERSGILPRVA